MYMYESISMYCRHAIVTMSVGHLCGMKTACMHKRIQLQEGTLLNVTLVKGACMYIKESICMYKLNIVDFNEQLSPTPIYDLNSLWSRRT